MEVSASLETCRVQESTQTCGGQLENADVYETRGARICVGGSGSTQASDGQSEHAFVALTRLNAYSGHAGTELGYNNPLYAAVRVSHAGCY